MRKVDNVGETGKKGKKIMLGIVANNIVNTVNHLKTDRLKRQPLVPIITLPELEQPIVKERITS